MSTFPGEGQDIDPGVVSKRCSATEETNAVPPKSRIGAGDRCHRLGLIDRAEQRPPNSNDPIERVENEIGVIARRPEGGDDRVEHSEINGRNKTSLLALSARPIRGAATDRAPTAAALKSSRLRMTLSLLPALPFRRL